MSCCPEAGAPIAGGGGDVTCLEPGTVDGQLVQWDAATECYIPVAAPSGTGQIAQWNQTTGRWVVTAAPTDGQRMRFNAASGLWVPAPDGEVPLAWGAASIANLANPSFLYPYVGGQIAAAATDIHGISFPWAGVIDSLCVRHNVGVAQNVVIPYTVVIDGVVSTLTVSRNANSAGVVSDLVNSVAVPANGKISLQAVNTTVSTAVFNPTATARFRRT